MSNWMTSGSARLKAKQNSSFSRRARQRAAIVASSGPMIKGIPPPKRFPLAKPRRNGAKRKYTYGNPITRRGVMVSIGSAANYNQHCDDHPIESTLSGYIATTEKAQSLNKSSSASSESNTPYNPMHDLPRRRIRDTSSKYRRCSSNLKRPANQTMSSNYDYDYSQHAVSHVHHPVYTRHAMDPSSYQQSDPPFQNDYTSSEVYNDKAQKVAHPSLRPEPVAQNYASQLSSNHNRNNAFEYDPQTHDKLLQQEAIGTMTCQNLDHAQFSFDNEPFQKGIRRFQKRGKDHSDLILEAEGRKNNLFDQRNNDSPGNMNNYGKDDVLEAKSRHSALSGSGSIFPIESSRQWQPQHRRQLFSETADSSDITRWKEHENEPFPENSHHQNLATQPQSNIAISNNDASLRLSNINIESNSIGGPHSPSNYMGISKFKRRRQENTNLKLGHSFQARRIQSDETIFQYTGISDGFNSSRPDPICLDENEDQSESRTSSIRFFDDQNEIDISGNPLNMPRSDKKELRTNLFGAQQMKSRDDTIGEGRSSIASLLENGNVDKLECQQTSTASPDTDYLKGTSFGDESIWTFFR